ncbi:MAG: hypothetical protein J6T10_08705 [Methanobrevibacter sp.]|nr:hypothetical protein [Methanobrevibacter sp.]
MVYYVKYDPNESGVILAYINKEDVDSGRITLQYPDTIDYIPIVYNNKMYTREKFSEIEATQEYKDEQAKSKKDSFDWESKQFENDASYIQYKGKKIPLTEILFKSLIYNSVTDLYVYLKAEDGTLIKTLRATFLLIVAKAKLNLKLVEDALYDADNQFDPKKTLEENIAKIKGIFDAIDKIFND